MDHHQGAHFCSQAIPTSTLSMLTYLQNHERSYFSDLSHHYSSLNQQEMAALLFPSFLAVITKSKKCKTLPDLDFLLGGDLPQVRVRWLGICLFGFISMSPLTLIPFRQWTHTHSSITLVHVLQALLELFRAQNIPSVFM